MRCRLLTRLHCTVSLADVRLKALHVYTANSCLYAGGSRGADTGARRQQASGRTQWSPAHQHPHHQGCVRVMHIGATSLSSIARMCPLLKDFFPLSAGPDGLPDGPACYDCPSS